MIEMILDAHRLSELAGWFFDPTAQAPEGVSESRAGVARELFATLFLTAPAFVLDDAKVSAFEALISRWSQQPSGQMIAYDCPYPKCDFLRYLVHAKGYLLHGSCDPQIEVMEPRMQSDWMGRPMNAIFATRDGIWPMFFAILDRPKLRGSIRNACLVVEPPGAASERFYYFSVHKDDMANGVWTSGTIYVLPPETFEPTSAGPVRFDEWSSTQPAPVLARLAISPSDFPFLSQVTAHTDEEPLFTTWQEYKRRLAPM